MVRLLVLLGLFLIPFVGKSQRAITEDSSFKDRVYFGGGGGFSGGTDSYGNRYFYVALNPIMGYMITQQWSTGMGVQWQLYRYPDINYSLNQYGFSPFTRYNLGNLFAYAEYNVINTSSISTDVRQYYNRLLAGVGYSLPISRRGSINGMALYDFIYRNNGPFASPWVVRVFFSF